MLVSKAMNTIITVKLSIIHFMYRFRLDLQPHVVVWVDFVLRLVRLVHVAQCCPSLIRNLNQLKIERRPESSIRF